MLRPSIIFRSKSGLMPHCEISRASRFKRILQRDRRRRAAEEFHHLLQRVRPFLRLDGAVVNLADQFEQFSIRSHELCFLK